MQKFPFLMEMFYWIMSFAAYRCSHILSQIVFSKTRIWDVAQDHALAVLEFEQYSWLSFLWPIQEVEVQQWFMHRHEIVLTVLNRTYALIHIPGTVAYVGPLKKSRPLLTLLALSPGTITPLLHTRPSLLSAEQ